MAQTTIMPERVTEQALRTFLEGKAIAGLQILTRFEMTKEVLPSLKIAVENARPDFIDDTESQTGNWICTVGVTLKSHAQDVDGDSHDALMGEVMWYIFTDSIVSDLNAASSTDEFTAFDVRTGERRNWNDEDHFYTQQAVDIYMMPSATA